MAWGGEEGWRPDWGRAAERVLFLFPPVIGVGVIGVLQELDPAVPLLGSALVLVGSFGYVALSVGLAVVLAVDARQLRGASDWHPRPVVLALLALLAAPAVGVYYLYRRHRSIGTPAGWSGWWLAVAVVPAVSLVGTALALAGALLAIPELVFWSLAIAGAVAVGLFPIALHQDAAYVARTGTNWRPNPATFLGLGFLGIFVGPLQLAVALYYLARRHRELDVP